MEPEPSRRVIQAFPTAARPRAPSGTGSSPKRGEPTLAELTWTLIRGRWLILAVTAAFLLLGIAYLVVATPLYETNVVIQVEGRPKTLAGLEDVSALFAESTPADTEMQIIRSRTLLGPIAEELHLDIVASPKTFPIFGRMIARGHSGKAPAPPLLGLDDFAWGGDRVRVTRLSVPERLLDKPLILQALGGGRFQLQTAEGENLALGEVGKPAVGMAGDEPVEIFVQELQARPRTRFNLLKLRQSDVVDRLQHDLKIAEVGKKTGVISVSMTGPDPEALRAFLDAVAQSYQRQNVGYKSGEAAKTLEFLETQLPVLKQNLDAAEGALSAFRLRTGTVDLTRETQGMLERAVEVEKALSELELQRSELRQRFNEGHPILVSISEKAGKLRAQLSGLQAKMRALPETEVDSARLVREAKVANELYSLLTNKAQNLRILKSGTIGNVRILDQAVLPLRPVSPKAPLILAACLFLGLAGGMGLVLLRKAFDEGADDPDEIEASTGLPVFVGIPHSDKQKLLARAASRHPDRRLPLLATVDAGDGAVETLRVLRTSLQIALAEAHSNVLAIGSPSPGVGKSFVCANLASVFASAGSTVLLVDGDLRRGTIHRYFGLERGPGVTDVVTGQVQLADAIRQTSIPNLYVLPAGKAPANPSELLGSDRFRQAVEALAGTYDFVVMDTPPILAVADSALVGRHAGVNVLVLRAGRHPVGEIALAAKRLEQGGARVNGVVLNEVRFFRGRYGKHGRYQRYEYRSTGRD